MMETARQCRKSMSLGRQHVWKRQAERWCDRKCDWDLETISAPSRTQINKENQSLFSCLLEDDYKVGIWERGREVNWESVFYQLCLDRLNMGRFSSEQPQSDHHSRKSRWLHDENVHRGLSVFASYTTQLNVCGHPDLTNTKTELNQNEIWNEINEIKIFLWKSSQVNVCCIKKLLKCTIYSKKVTQQM